MSEEQFWRELYMRFRSEGHAGMDGAVDWIEPNEYYMAASPSYVLGRVGIIGDHHHTERQFTLYLDRTYASVQDVEWHLSVPSVDGCWYVVDEDGITINPAHRETDLTR